MDDIKIGINETIVDFSVASYKFAEHFGDSKTLTKWFDKMELSYNEDPKQTFERVAAKAIESIAKEEQRYLINDEKEAMVKLLLQLPDHKNASEKLANLKIGGAKVVAVLNKSENRMTFKEISECFK